jgi:MoaA/NifB/PqqE/SkfB family radical SAM enzyme
VETIADRLGGALVNVNITGGEPFLSDDLWPICRAYYQRAGVRSVYITTHGGFPERVEALVRSFLALGMERQLFLSISIDGLFSEHDRLRGRQGLFDRAMDSYGRVAAIADPRVGVGVSITVSEHNFRGVTGLFHALREELGVEVVTATLRRAQGAAGALPSELRARVGQAYSELTSQMERHRRGTPRRGARRSVLARLQDAKDEVLYAMLRQDALSGSRYRSPCPAGGLFAVLHPDGEVSCCEVLTDGRLGNLRDHGLDMGALLQAEEARTLRRRILLGRCHCTYECALGINIVTHLRYLPRLALAGVSGAWDG